MGRPSSASTQLYEQECSPQSVQQDTIAQQSTCCRTMSLATGAEQPTYCSIYNYWQIAAQLMQSFEQFMNCLIIWYRQADLSCAGCQI